MHPMLRNLMLGATALALTASLAGAPTAVSAQTSAPTAVTAPGSPAAMPASRVKALQEALSEQGLSVTTDGVLNEETRAAIRKYQSQHHLPVTGEPDQATLDKLGVAAGSARGQGMSSAGMSQAGMGQGCPMGGATGQGCPMMGQGMMGQGMGQGMGQRGMMGMMGDQGGMHGMMGGRGPGAGMGSGEGGMRGPNMMRLMFALMDADGDGALSTQEFQAAHERIFKAADGDDDGSLTMEEMQGFMHGPGKAAKRMRAR